MGVLEAYRRFKAARVEAKVLHRFRATKSEADFQGCVAHFLGLKKPVPFSHRGFQEAVFQMQIWSLSDGEGRFFRDALDYLSRAESSTSAQWGLWIRSLAKAKYK